MRDAAKALMAAFEEDFAEYREVYLRNGQSDRANHLFWRMMVFEKLADIFDAVSVISTLEEPTPENIHNWKGRMRDLFNRDMKS